jgi:pyrroline-5-carboxylate reductase
MGEAILRGILRAKLINRSRVVVGEKRAARRNYLRAKYRINIGADNRRLAKDAAIIILSVKPQDINSVLDEIKPVLRTDRLIISICAGVRSGYIERSLGKRIAVIRVMPNMPALIAAGISAIAKGRFAKRKDVDVAGAIFSGLGETILLKENRLDAVTALSGSGPAYIFYIAESLIAAGRHLGFSAESARKLALKTVLGSAKLMDISGSNLSVLIKKVASKGGTTEAALKVFEKDKLAQIIAQAVKAAFRRSKQLSQR